MSQIESMNRNLISKP